MRAKNIELVPAQDQFVKYKVAKQERDPIEKLRAFCSFAMKMGQDWLDIEQHFDAVIAERKKLKSKNRKLRKELKKWK